MLFSGYNPLFCLEHCIHVLLPLLPATSAGHYNLGLELECLDPIPCIHILSLCLCVSLSLSLSWNLFSDNFSHAHNAYWPLSPLPASPTSLPSVHPTFSLKITLRHTSISFALLLTEWNQGCLCDHGFGPGHWKWVSSAVGIPLNPVILFS